MSTSRLPHCEHTSRARRRPHTNLVARIWNPLQRKAGLVDSTC